MDIDIFVSDYVLANLMKIQGALTPPPEEKVEEVETPRHKHPKEESKRNKPGADILRKQARSLELEEDSKADYNNEDNEGEENIEGEEDDDINDTRSISAKSKGEVDDNPENQILKIDKTKKVKVDQRILIIFDKMIITLGEVIPLNVAESPEYEGIIDVNRSEIPHVNILEVAFEGLEIEFNNGSQQTLNLIMNRFYIKDLQLVRKLEDGIEQEAAPLIPECFQMVMSNPEIEKEFDEGSSCYTMNTKNFKTEDFKSLRGDEESIVDMDQNINNLAQLKVTVRMFGPCTDVEFIFSNLRLIVTLPIIERLSKFQHKMTKLQEENTADLETKSKILQMIEESDSEDSDDFEVENDNKLKRTAMILLDAQNQKKVDSLEDKGYYERFKEERNRYLMKGKKLKIKILNQINKISAKGKLSNFEIWVPLDSVDKYSRVLSLGLSSHVGYRASTFTRHKINEITMEMIESKVIRNQQDANVVITQLCVSMINRHLLQVQGELTSEKILLPSRIDLSYDKFMHSLKETDITNVEMIIEPIDLKVGFREIDNFKKLGEVMGEFASRLSAPPEEEHKLNLDEEELEGMEMFKETQQIGIDQKQLVEAIEEETEVKKQKVSIKDRKVKEFIKMNVKLISESINLALMDDTGSHEYPLVNFSINKILATVHQETGEDDAKNFILKKMGISKYPALKVDAALLFEANYFNIDSGSYEPLIEPWTFNAMVLQKSLYSAQEVKLSSDEMLNLNLTYGMALAVKRIQTKINQKTEQWEDENKAEETKRKTRSQTGQRTLTKNGKSTIRKTRDGEEDEEVAGFYFENHLGLAMRITLENHDTWKEQGIKLSEEDEDICVLQFLEWEDSGDRNFRTLKEIHAINKNIKKQQNDGKLVESYAENIIRCDIYFDDFEPITGVPIEIAGRRSYELASKNLTDKQRKKDKYEFSITVDVTTEGSRKVVSFESQLSIVNKTEFDIEVAQVFSDSVNKDETELSKQQIEDALGAMKGEAKLGGQKVTRFDDIIPFDPVFANSTYKIPLTWFLDEVAIFYKCERGKSTSYRKIMPNLKKLLLKKDDEDKPWEDLTKFHLLRQESIDNTFIALDVISNKCRPTAMDRPPHFE